MTKKVKAFIISILIAWGVGGLSAYLTRNNMNIYDEIITPAITPPSIVFPIVWSILYTLMGIGAALVFTSEKSNSESRADALTIYAINLVFNFAWSIIFFNMRNFRLSFVWIVLLAIIVFYMILKFYKVSKPAAYMQISYFLWVVFAAYLDFLIYVLNK